MSSALQAHLATRSTTLCRAWQVRRADGVTLGFTDHDRDLTFAGVIFAAGTGLTASALQHTTGMAVDNSEALGALSDASVREEDIAAGRYDGAEVTVFLVNWSNVAERSVLFRGHFGEITRSNGAFRVELRGQTEALNRTTGRVYHAECGARLGDALCRVDVDLPAHSVTLPLAAIRDGRMFDLGPLEGFAPGWFAGGQIVVRSGRAAGQTVAILADRDIAGRRIVESWHAMAVLPEAGDLLRLVTGCDKRAATCRAKFDNFLNFRGFPHIPGEDWLRSSPGLIARG